MSKKSFNSSYMHPTRRKLVNMVNTGGEYEANTTIGWTKAAEKRKIGDTWEDEFNNYEQKNGFIIKSSKNSGTYKEIRDYLREKDNCKNSECQTIRLKRIDKKLIKKAGYCLNCLSVIETEIRAVGLWEPYQNYKIWTRMIIDGKMRLEQIQQAHDEAKQVYEYLNEDGTYDKWEMPQDVAVVKEEMLVLIKNGTLEIEELEEMRIEAFNELSAKNYEHTL